MGGRLYSSKPHTKKNTKLLLLLHIVFVLTWQLCFFYTSILATTDFSLSGTILFTVSLLVLRRPKWKQKSIKSSLLKITSRTPSQGEKNGNRGIKKRGNNRKETFLYSTVRNGAKKRCPFFFNTNNLISISCAGGEKKNTKVLKKRTIHTTNTKKRKKKQTHNNSSIFFLLSHCLKPCIIKSYNCER